MDAFFDGPALSHLDSLLSAVETLTAAQPETWQQHVGTSVAGDVLYETTSRHEVAQLIAGLWAAVLVAQRRRCGVLFHGEERRLNGGPQIDTRRAQQPVRPMAAAPASGRAHMISPWLRFSVLALAVIAYAGAVGLAWTCAQHTCATAFIHNLTLSSSIAIVFSTAAVFVQLARLRWLTSRTPRERRLLLFSGTPAVGVIICWAVALAVVDSSAPNNALSPARAAGPTAHCEAARSGSGG